MRMKRIQMIMEAVRIHQETIKKPQVKNQGYISNSWEQNAIEKKVKFLTKRIAASRKRARDLWSKGI